MTALQEDRKALLEKEARLAGTAASEWGCTGLQVMSCVACGSRDHMLGLHAVRQHMGVSMVCWCLIACNVREVLFRSLPAGLWDACPPVTSAGALVALRGLPAAAGCEGSMRRYTDLLGLLAGSE